MTEENVPATVFGSTSIADSVELLKNLETTASEGGVNTDVQYMSFSGKKGIYSIGQEKREPTEGELFLVDANGFELGWMCWKGGKPVAKRMANVRGTAIPEPDLNEFGPFDDRRGEGWSRARAISVKSLYTGEQCYFSTSSKTGVSAMASLQKTIVGQLQSGQNPWPVVEFGADDVKINDFDVPIPVIEVDRWLSNANVQDLADGKSLDELDVSSDTPTDHAPTPKKRLR